MSSWFRTTSESEALLAEERLVLAATESVYEAMDRAGINSRQLAAKLRVRPSEISQRLSGRRNLTLRSLAAMLHVLGMRADIVISPTDLGTRIEPTETPLSDESLNAGVTNVTNITNIQINLHPSGPAPLFGTAVAPFTDTMWGLSRYLDADVPQLPQGASATSPVAYWNGERLVGPLNAAKTPQSSDATEAATT